jgi:hypothetical protein
MILCSLQGGPCAQKKKPRTGGSGASWGSIWGEPVMEGDVHHPSDVSTSVFRTTPSITDTLSQIKKKLRLMWQAGREDPFHKKKGELGPPASSPHRIVQLFPLVCARFVSQ